MATPHPKYVATTDFSIGRHSFKAGDPVPASAVLETIVRLGFAVPAKSRADSPDQTADPAPPKE